MSWWEEAHAGSLGLGVLAPPSVPWEVGRRALLPSAPSAPPWPAVVASPGAAAARELDTARREACSNLQGHPPGGIRVPPWRPWPWGQAWACGLLASLSPSLPLAFCPAAFDPLPSISAEAAPRRAEGIQSVFPSLGLERPAPVTCRLRRPAQAARGPWGGNTLGSAGPVSLAAHCSGPAGLPSHGGPPSLRAAGVCRVPAGTAGLSPGPLLASGPPLCSAAGRDAQRAVACLQTPRLCRSGTSSSCRLQAACSFSPGGGQLVLEVGVTLGPISHLALLASARCWLQCPRVLILGVRGERGKRKGVRVGVHQIGCCELGPCTRGLAAFQARRSPAGTPVGACPGVLTCCSAGARQAPPAPPC